MSSFLRKPFRSVHDRKIAGFGVECSDSVRTMRLGINLPTSSLGRAMGAAYDFGRATDPAGREVVPAWKLRDGQQFLDELTAMYDTGVRAVRWFFLGGGAALGRPEFLETSNRFGTETSPEGRALIEGAGAEWYAAGQWSFVVPDEAQCATVATDFVRMLRMVKRFNEETEARRRDPIKILPSWVGFRFFLGPGALRLEWDTPSIDDRANYDFSNPVDVELWFAHRALSTAQIVPGGRMDILLDPRKRAQFFRRVMIPTLHAVTQEEGLRDQVLYWEVGNELDGLLSGVREHQISNATRESLPGVPWLTRALYRFVSEVIALHRGHPIRVGNTTLRANVGTPLRTTVGWLRWDGDSGLQQSLRDRRWLHDHPRAAGGATEIEDVFQFHAYMSMHHDESLVVYLPPATPRQKTFEWGMCEALDAVPHNLLVGSQSYGGWRTWPSAQEIREYAVQILGDALHATMNFPPDLAVRVDTDAHIPCVIGEMHLLPASGDASENRQPERWVKHFSVPWAVLPSMNPFVVREVRWDSSTERHVQITPDHLGERLHSEFPWTYEHFMDNLTGRLHLLHTLGYSWALPWAWNIGSVERPLEYATTPGDVAARTQETPAAFWQRLRISEQLRAFSDAMRGHE
jgi:hypothetical protein